MKKRKMYKRFKRYIRRTYKNKLCALALIILGLLTVFIEYDATFFIVTLLIGIPLFLEKENQIG